MTRYMNGKNEEKACNTRCSQAVTHLSTNRARRSLSSEIERDRKHSTWYGRRQTLLTFLGTNCKTTYSFLTKSFFILIFQEFIIAILCSILKRFSGTFFVPDLKVVILVRGISSSMRRWFLPARDQRSSNKRIWKPSEVSYSLPPISFSEKGRLGTSNPNGSTEISK